MSLKEEKFWPKWDVTISDTGRILFPNPDQWEKFKIPYHGREMTVILKPRVKDRSRQEEKFYWAVVVTMVAEEMQIGRDEAHRFMAGLFLTIEERTASGIGYRRVLSTTELSDRAYREYWENCIKWAAQPTEEDGLNQRSGLSLSIPMPNEVDYQDSK